MWCLRADGGALPLTPTTDSRATRYAAWQEGTTAVGP
jgi:hypothetical protein